MFQVNTYLNNRYNLKEQLGHTAKGRQTWLAFDTVSQENIVIKLLAFVPQMDWGEIELFEREAKTLQALNHPQIPQYRDYFDLSKEEGSGVPWFALVQEYIDGESLHKLVQDGKRFTESEVRDIAKEVLEILSYLHQLNPTVLHRDIKPSNLILGTNKKIYLVDFGAVQEQATVTGMTFTVVGTSGYAPLEQFYGRAVPASDIYALGATIIYLLTGIEPMYLTRKDSQLNFADKIDVSDGLVKWLHDLTSLDVESRPQNAEEALRRLKYINSRIVVKHSKDIDNLHTKAKKAGIELNISQQKLEICFLANEPFLDMLPVLFVFAFIFLHIVNSSFAEYAFYLIFLYPIIVYILRDIIGIKNKITLREQIIFDFNKLFISSKSKNYSLDIDDKFDISVIEHSHDRGKDNSYHLKIKNRSFTWESEAWHKADLDLLVTEVKNWLKNNNSINSGTDPQKTR